MFESVGDPEVVLGGADVHAAVPHEPVGARAALPCGPALAAVELGDVEQEPAGGGGDVAGERGDLGLEAFGRQRSGFGDDGVGDVLTGRARGRREGHR